MRRIKRFVRTPLGSSRIEVTLQGPSKRPGKPKQAGHEFPPIRFRPKMDFSQDKYRLNRAVFILNFVIG